jgi:hypothetical protein
MLLSKLESLQQRIQVAHQGERYFYYWETLLSSSVLLVLVWQARPALHRLCFANLEHPGLEFPQRNLAIYLARLVFKHYPGQATKETILLTS